MNATKVRFIVYSLSEVQLTPRILLNHFRAGKGNLSVQKKLQLPT
jgi:hypothetical protein